MHGRHETLLRVYWAGTSLCSFHAFYLLFLNKFSELWLCTLHHYHLHNSAKYVKIMLYHFVLITAYFCSCFTIFFSLLNQPLEAQMEYLFSPPSRHRPRVCWLGLPEGNVFIERYRNLFGPAALPSLTRPDAEGPSPCLCWSIVRVSAPLFQLGTPPPGSLPTGSTDIRTNSRKAVVLKRQELFTALKYFVINYNTVHSIILKIQKAKEENSTSSITLPYKDIQF